MFFLNKLSVMKYYITIFSNFLKMFYGVHNLKKKEKEKE